MEKNPDHLKRDGRWAPLANLSAGSRAMERALERSPHLPGIVVLHAPYGTGKSMTESYCMNEYDGFLVECQSYFTRKNFVQMILKEMDVKPARTVGDMMEQAAEQLEKSTRPLILDDVHRITHSSVLGLVLDLHNMSRTTIMLAGDEAFPAALHRADGQLSSRVLVWQPLQPATLEDARKLAAFYCPGIDVREDLLAWFREKTKNNARLICVNLEHVRDQCQKNGFKKYDLDAWGKRDVFAGDAGLRRAA